MINVKKLKINIELTIRGSIILERTDVNSVPDAIVKDGHLFIITDCDCNSVLYTRSKVSPSDYIRTLLSLDPENPYFIAYV